ncbi:hypothetical protein [Vibrio antiquarius]|uniref:hypothetical protein n=1 Tax=Vibrio antiquarius (strain Ex25) TaxID=150340 RepID=UPI00265B627B|nr:hypothetical protein [Vibrio antiquarius]MCR9845829.1 hypothetical protein [Vibrio antiquarius]MCR9911306.1 hypothetical protein [Vibrio antiquarius]
MLCLDQAVYKFIDVKLSKDGRIISVDVSNAFSFWRQKVRSVVTKYRTDYPKNMHHAFHQKCYLCGNDFKAHLLTTHSPEEYINAVGVIIGGQ